MVRLELSNILSCGAINLQCTIYVSCVCGPAVWGGGAMDCGGRQPDAPASHTAHSDYTATHGQTARPCARHTSHTRRGSQDVGWDFEAYTLSCSQEPLRHERERSSHAAHRRAGGRRPAWKRDQDCGNVTGARADFALPLHMRNCVVVPIRCLALGTSPAPSWSLRLRSVSLVTRSHGG